MNSAAAQSLAEAPPAPPPPPPAGGAATSPQPQPSTPARTAAQGLASISSPPPALPAPIEPSPLAPSPEDPSLRQPTPTPSAHLSFEHHHHLQQSQPHSHHQPLLPHPHHLQTSSPPLRKDTSSSISTQATTTSLASTETNNTSYSADTSPNLHQSIFSIKDGSDVSNNRRTSRRRTGPLSQQSRERAALIRKLGACGDCRRRRVACHPSHHNMTWEDVVSKFHRSHSPSIQDIAPSLAAGRTLSPGPPLANVQPMFTHDPQEMEIDSPAPTPQQSGRPPLSETRIRTPLPSGPRLEKSQSLPGIESLKNDLQTNAGRMLSTPSRDRYSIVKVLLLYWQEDEDAETVETAVSDLAEVFDKYYHYSFQVQAIPSSSDVCKNSWRWLSRQMNDFADDHDQRDALKIVYYVGHTFLDGNREMVLASSKNKDTCSMIRWNGIQQILEEACSDTLIIMDAAYYPSSAMLRQRGVLEIIAAATSQEHFNALDRCSFTRALSDLLKTRATRVSPLSAAEAHTALFTQYTKLVEDKTPEKEMVTSFPSPIHLLMSGNSRLPSIYLAPVHTGNALRTGSIGSFENNPQLHLSLRLVDDNVEPDIWNEWLRLMPDGVKDVKVDGPFRTTFR